MDQNIILVDHNVHEKDLQRLTTDENSSNGENHDIDIVDPWCDPENLHFITFDDIVQAKERIKSLIIHTPCTKAHFLSDMLGMELYFKRDFQQVTGSYKERGALNTLLLLDEESRKRGVIAASAGNHAQALSYHGKLLNVKVTVVMPEIAPLMKIDMCKKRGAAVVIYGKDFNEAKCKALHLAKEHGYVYINGFDHPHAIAGLGSLGVEILQDDVKSNVDAVLVPVGGGGALAGISLAVKHLSPKTKVYGVEAERCPSFTEALKIGKPVKIKPGSTSADGLCVPQVGYNALAIAQNLIDGVITVDEESLALAILRLLELEKCVVEAAGAAPLAAILSGILPELKGKRVVALLSGGNIDTTCLGHCIERGLVHDRRLIEFTVQISDRPGGMMELSTFLYRAGVSIKDLNIESPFVMSDIFSTRVNVVAETRDAQHADQLVAALKKHYKHVICS
uniref:L-serine deaminase n=1 Tax=Romanomermis culicivorax TaxID=13658 RepID=A0A915JSX3_ROMCU